MTLTPATKKKLLDKEWRPKNGERYWMVLELLPNKAFLCAAKAGNFGSSESEIKRGNCFKTKSEARKSLQDQGYDEVE